MQGVICFTWVQRVFPPQKQWSHQHPLFKVIIVALKTSEGDEIMWRSPNFVTLQNNEYSRPRQCPRSKWLWTMPRPLLYRFQYQKKSWGGLKNIWWKKMFSAKSMTKLEALTVQIKFTNWVLTLKWKRRCKMFSRHLSWGTSELLYKLAIYPCTKKAFLLQWELLKF